MQIKHGTTRVVFVIPCLGIAIKIAKINLFKGFNSLFINPWHYQGFKNCWSSFLDQFRFTCSELCTFRYYWFRGINANWQELIFYQKTKHPLLQPTYFTFFGLANIQKIARTPLTTKSDSYYQFTALSEIAKGEHVFQNPENFCLENGQLRFLDYADPATREAIVADGQALLAFNPDWDFEAHKKSRPNRYSPT